MPVILATATKGEGVDELIGALDRQFDWLAASGQLAERRRRRLSTVRTRWWIARPAGGSGKRRTPSVRWPMHLDEVADGRMSPYDVATEVVAGLRQGARA